MMKKDGDSHPMKRVTNNTDGENYISYTVCNCIDVNYESQMAQNLENAGNNENGGTHIVKNGFLPQMSITKKQSEYPGICVGDADNV